LTAAAYTCLMVALTVAEPAVVSLTVHDHAPAIAFPRRRL